MKNNNKTSEQDNITIELTKFNGSQRHYKKNLGRRITSRKMEARCENFRAWYC